MNINKARERMTMEVITDYEGPSNFVFYCVRYLASEIEGYRSLRVHENDLRNVIIINNKKIISRFKISLVVQ